MNKEKISVIIPVYNAELYLKECLDSICNNTYIDLEIILLNDGSLDRSGKICDDYAQKDARIKVFHKKNQGVSATRNLGIKYATGKYIAFIDSDDYVEKNYFKSLYENLKMNDTDLSVCRVAHKTKNDISMESHVSFILKLENITRTEIENFYYLNKQYLLYGPCNKIYRKNIIVEHEISFPEDTSYGEDLLFNFEYLKFCKSISFTEESRYIYNHNNIASLSHIYRENLYENGIRLNNQIIKFSVEHGLYGKEMQRYCSTRIFDDAYNAIFLLWDPKCTLTAKQKRKRIRDIVNSEELKEAIKYARLEQYNKVYVNLIKCKSVWGFYFIREIKRGK